MAATIRTVKSNGYRMMSIAHLTDKRLTWTAKGMLSALLALSGEYTIDEVVCLASGGKSDADGSFAELEKYGYLKRDSRKSEILYTFYDKPLAGGTYYSEPEAEIPYEEDMPGKALAPGPEYNEEEEQLRLREKLNMCILAEKYSENFVEMVFRELCRRDADFRQIMTAKAYEAVCLIAWERYIKSGKVIPGSYEFSAVINGCFDNVVSGIQSVGGGNGRAEHQVERDKRRENKI